MKRLVLALALFGVLLSGFPAAGDEVREIYTQEFYDGITVTSMRFASGNFVALVSSPEDGEVQMGRSVVRAQYDLRIAARRGIWRLRTPEQGSPVETVFDYGSGDFSGQLDTILASHTVRSVALSALWLWEDHLVEESLEGKLTLKSCATCTSRPNGCSPAWITPQSCAGTSIVEPCRRHDDCYQCGAECEGKTRAQCDLIFRQDVADTTGSSWCGYVYWLGVRALGWLAFQDPNGRAYMGPDVYSVGVSISACEGQYAHMCTVYVM